MSMYYWPMLVVVMVEVSLYAVLLTNKLSFLYSQYRSPCEKVAYMIILFTTSIFVMKFVWMNDHK